MSRFTENNFFQVIMNLETSEASDENIWIAVGILEQMYDDDRGYIDEYFHTPKNQRCTKKELWNKLQGQLTRNFL